MIIMGFACSIYAYLQHQCNTAARIFMNGTSVKTAHQRMKICGYSGNGEDPGIGSGCVSVCILFGLQTVLINLQTA